MANFTPPFSDTADKRYPTADERQNGFPCGPADRQLFNGILHRLESEVGNVIAHAGLTQTDADMSQLRKAIEALITAATGGGDPASYVTMAQASSRLPFYPEVQNADGRIEVTSPLAGTIRIPGGVNFIHRGISPYATAQQDFATAASKIYHLRWRPTGGFVLLETGDAAYNPSGLPETNLAFDSQFDDMLVARIITNASNVATITNLSNKTRLAVEGVNSGAITELPYTNGATRTAQVAWNFSRTPVVSLHHQSIGTQREASATGGGFYGSDSHDHDEQMQVNNKTRYGASIKLLRDYASSYSVAYQAIAL